MSTAAMVFGFVLGLIVGAGGMFFLFCWLFAPILDCLPGKRR